MQGSRPAARRRVLLRRGAVHRKRSLPSVQRPRPAGPASRLRTWNQAKKPVNYSRDITIRLDRIERELNQPNPLHEEVRLIAARYLPAEVVDSLPVPELRQLALEELSRRLIAWYSQERASGAEMPLERAGEASPRGAPG